MKGSTFRTYSILTLFLLAIAFPLLNTYGRWVKDIESFENRSMSKEPMFDLFYPDPFPAAYETFYNDNFNLRNRLIRCFNICKIVAFRKSPVNTVIIGADNWLFHTGDAMDSYQGKNRFTTSELQSFKKELDYRKSYFDQRGIKFYFLIIPCKATIYPEKIGYEYFRMHKDSWGEQLNDYLAKNTAVNVINVFDTLRNHKNAHDLFHRLDNHWNDLGAFYTANAVLQRMHADFPGVNPLSEGDFERKPAKRIESDLEKMLGNPGLFSQPSFELHSKRGMKSRMEDGVGYPSVPGFAYPWEFEKVRVLKDPTKQPRLLIISDSFGTNIFPFLSENFSKTVKIFDAWNYGLNETIVEEEKPDAVILMVNEPILRHILQCSPRTRKN